MVRRTANRWRARLAASRIRFVAQSSASRDAEGRLDLYVRVRGSQSGAHAEPDAQHSSGVVRAGRGVAERSSNATFGRSLVRKITSQLLENSGITQTNLEIARSARFFSGLLELFDRENDPNSEEQKEGQPRTGKCAHQNPRVSFCDRPEIRDEEYQEQVHNNRRSASVSISKCITAKLNSLKM